MNIFIATIEKETADLNAEESWHCCKVLRKKTGDLVSVIDGKGHIAEGQLTLVTEKKCSVALSSPVKLQKKHNYYLHLAIAPTKQIDRIEWMIEKAVEIGIDEISFIQCKHSERVNLKIDRIHKIVESAVKQSLQAYIPKINPLINFDEFILVAGADQKLLAHCYNHPKTEIRNLLFENKNTLVCIGPEGDFSIEEIEKSAQLNFQFVSLGKTRLRTETAGLYACMTAALTVK